MCGIFAYCNFKVQRNRKAILQILIEGLKYLEYRGCDSAGLAIDGDCSADGVPVIYRQVGKVDALEDLVHNTCTLDLSRSFEVHVGIAHTRWATHGAPSPHNAHPQTSSPENEFVVVHNGIITNQEALHELLTTWGYAFSSETDTEVIPKLCQHFYKAHEGKVMFPELLKEVLTKLEGPFGVVLKSSHFPNELVAAKRGSPLILSTTVSLKAPITADEEPETPLANEFFITSDPTPLVAFGQHVQYLEDGDVVHIKNGQLKVYNVAAQIRCSPRTDSFAKEERLAAMRRGPVTVMDLDMLMKGHHKHFMLKEIHEQTESLRNTMRGRLNFKTKTVKLGGIDGYKQIITRARRIMIMAVGSGYYGALAVRNTLEELADIPVSIELACEYPDRHPPIFRDDVCCFVNFSGENSVILDLLEYCKKRGALCIGFTNVVGSRLAKATDCGMYLHAGFEVGVSRTKAFTSEIVALLMFALVISEDNLKVQPRREAIMNALERLPGDVQAALTTSQTMEKMAMEFKDHNNFLCLGRGHQTATCMEAALNLKEAALVHSEGIHLGELKHGPLALVDEEMPVLVICTREDRGQKEEDDAMYPKVKSSLQQVLARHGRPIVIANNDEQGDDGTFWQEVYEKVVVPKTLDCLQTIVNIVPLQLFAYHLAVKRGIDPDRAVHFKPS